MFRFLGSVLLGFALGAAAMYSAFSYHVVRADDEWLWVRKHRPTLELCLVDVRQWKTSDWMDNLPVAQALIDHGRGDLVKPLNPGGLLTDLLKGLDQSRQGDSDRR